MAFRKIKLDNQHYLRISFKPFSLFQRLDLLLGDQVLPAARIKRG